MEPWGALEEREAKEKPTHHLFQPDLCAVRTPRSSLTPPLLKPQLTLDSSHLCPLEPPGSVRCPSFFPSLLL